MREQPVATGDVEHATAAKQASRAAGHFPRLVELLARQAAGFAHRAAEPVEQRVAGEAVEIVPGQAILRAGIEGGRQAAMIRRVG